jgi:pyruvyltransferase
MMLSNIFGREKSISKKQVIYEVNDNHDLVCKHPIEAYWWDEKKNFGDWIGPWLISEITGRPVINIKDQNSINAIFSVGSVIEHISKNHKDSIIWGSGLIKKIENKNHKKNVANIKNINAVRGKLTYQELTEKCGIYVPKIFGDPALLLPKFYNPRIDINTKKPSICPHYIHYNYFKNEDLSKNFKIVNVLENPKKVIDEIVNSSLCISSSLHGIIIAQAYGVPWVWLQIVDKPLFGVDFKFHDFFSTCKSGNIPHVKLNADNINYSNMLNISKKANLNELNICLDELLNAFPFNGD